MPEKGIRAIEMTAVAQMSQGGALTIYVVLRVSQHQGCDFKKKCKRKGCFWTKMQEEGCVFWQRVYYSTTILKKILVLCAFFQQSCSEKGTVWENL